MIFGFISIDWDNQVLKTIGEILLDSGFEWMELHYPRYANGDNFFEEYRKINANLIKKYNPSLSLHLPGGDVNPASINWRIRQESLRQLKEAIDFGKEMGVSLVVMHPGEIRDVDFPPDAEKVEFERVRDSIAEARGRAWRLNVDAVVECANYAQKKGMKMTVENLFSPATLLKTSEQAHQFLLDANNSNIYWTLDAGHAFRAGINPAVFIERLGREVIHLHLNDNDGNCDLHLPLGKGSIDFVPLIQTLKKFDYKRAIVLEITSNKTEDFLESKAFLEDLLKGGEMSGGQ